MRSFQAQPGPFLNTWTSDLHSASEAMEIKQLSKVQGPMVTAHSTYWYSHYDWSHFSICFNILDIFDVFDIVKHFKFVFQRDSQNLWTAPSTSLTLPLRLIRMKRKSSGKLKIEQKCYGLFLRAKKAAQFDRVVKKRIVRLGEKVPAEVHSQLISYITSNIMFQLQE